MPSLAQQLPQVHIAINTAWPGQGPLNQALNFAEAVDQPPTQAEVAQFLDLLISPPANLAHLNIPARWVPTAQQQLALTMIAGPPGPPGIMGFPLYNLGGFLNAGGALAFTNFDRNLIALQLIIRVADPKRIHQRTHPLCGPNVLMESFARNYPDQYASYVIGLCTNRTGNINTAHGTKRIHLHRDSNLLDANPGHAEIRQADYVALASLRDQGHWFMHTPYESKFTIRMIEGGTMAMTLSRWLEDAGYQNVQDHTVTRANNLMAKMLRGQTRASYGQWAMQNNVQLAINELAGGRTVFLCVASNFAHFALGQVQRDATYMQAFGGHWVTLVNAAIQANGVDFGIRTWGTETVNAVTMPWTKVGNWYRGFVSATP